MFAQFRALKVLAVGVALVVLSPSAFAENKCKTGIQDCQDHGLDPDSLPSKDQLGNDLSKGYCKQISLNHRACRDERNLALAYTTMAAYCTTVCVMTYSANPATFNAAMAMRPYCYAGSAAVSLWEIVQTNMIKKEAEAYQDEEIKKISHDFGLDHWATKGVFAAWTSFSAFAWPIFQKTVGTGLQSVTQKGLSRGNICITAALNGIFAAVKWGNRSRIIDSSRDNLASAELLWVQQQKKGGGDDRKKYIQLASGGGSSSPPTVADVRSAAQQVNVADDNVDTARIGESYATEGTSKLFGNPKAEDYQKMLDVLNKHTGATPNALMDSLESSGVAGTLSKFTGDSEFGKSLGNAFKEMESKVNGMPAASYLAFDKTGSAGGGGSKGTSDNPLAGLFGARGPAADGGSGVKDIKFGGFNNDIWHAGSTLSIFEIVSRKTQTVSTRVGR